MKNILVIILILICCIALYAEEKPVISVLDFFTEEGISKSEMRLFISLLSSALFQTKIYTVIDVSERERLIKELKFATPACSEESCQLEMGKLLSSDAIIIGRIGRLGSRYVLSIKMLETDTGMTLNTADGIYDTIDAMVDDVGTIAKKLASTHWEREETVPEEEISETVDVTETDEIAEEEEEVIVTEPEPELVKKRFISFSVSLETGMKLIVIDLRDIFDFGVLSFIMFDMELNFGREKLGFGLVAGFHYDHTKDSVPQAYEMVTFPAGINIKYESGFILPFFFLAEIMGGITFSLVSYTWQIGIKNLPVIKPFGGITIGAGIELFKFIRVAAGVEYMIIFTDINTMQCIAPLVRAEIHF
ncbi:MAG: hypothetical protein JXB88_06475 [Spirochaetales bacterium]|nr:hypothetical protein [Spirochaetales bacterium]